jgi:hypothetical protein
MLLRGAETHGDSPLRPAGGDGPAAPTGTGPR